MDIKLKDSKDLNEHLALFEDLISLCGTPNNEAYIYFFNSLPKAYKGKFAERFPDSQPLDRTGRPSIHVAYDYARTLELFLKLSGEFQKNANGDRKVHDNKNNKRGNKTYDHGKDHKDDNSIGWGSAKKEENTFYRKHDRCFKCGRKGWSDPKHPCRHDGVAEAKANSRNE